MTAPIATCTHCNETKPAEAFTTNRKMRSGLSSWCRTCNYEATRKWRNRDDVKARRRAEYVGASFPSRICDGCGHEFTPRRAADKACSKSCGRKRYLSGKPSGFSDYHARMSEVWTARAAASAAERSAAREARDDARLERAIARINRFFRRCRTCGAAFVAARLNQFHCSRACARPAKGPFALVCTECSIDFTARRPNTHYCSPRCRRRGNPRRGSDKRVAAWRAMVVARMGAWCYLCSSPIDTTLHYSSPDSLTIDHILPVARGGADDLTNLQPAHRRCNVAKGDRMPSIRDLPSGVAMADLMGVSTADLMAIYASVVGAHTRCSP